MSSIIDLFPKISRAGEFVAFVHFQAPTKEGPAHLFMACDGFSKFGFNLCVESDESPASVIKAVYLLTENKDFVGYTDTGFTLVFDRWEELSDKLEAVVTPVNGKIIFNKKFHQKIAEPLVSSFSRFIQQGPKR